MRILHTADIHLRTVGDDRWSALESVLDLARDREVELVVISGDMFDRRFDAHNLKVPLRDVLQSGGVPIVILPGNHDAFALTEGDYYGENVSVLSHLDRPIDVGPVRLVGLPFEKITGERVIERLLSIRQHLRDDATNILLFHGELLDLVYSRDGYGEDEESGYMPVRLSTFDDVGVDYVLAGHFHSSFEVQKYEGGYFVYPGSPVSITKKEVGVRNVNLFDVGEPPQAVPLDTLHYEDVVVALDPFAAADPLVDVEKRLRACHKSARVLLTVRGFVDLAERGMTETQFALAINALKTSQVESISSQWSDAGVVRDNELFKRFVRKLDESELPEDRKSAIRRLALESMMEASHAD